MNLPFAHYSLFKIHPATSVSLYFYITYFTYINKHDKRVFVLTILIYLTLVKMDYTDIMID